MKKLLLLIAVAGALMLSCTSNDDKSWDEKKAWRDANNAWFSELQTKKNPDGTPYYEVITPVWNPGVKVLMHFFNDRSETEGNLSPIYTSTVDVRYKLHLYDGTAVDSSTAASADGKAGIFRTRLDETVQGWGIALPKMRCGDTAEVVIPYTVGYGAQSTGAVKAFSNLVFNIRLENIYKYEASPY